MQAAPAVRGATSSSNAGQAPAAEAPHSCGHSHPHTHSHGEEAAEPGEEDEEEVELEDAQWMPGEVLDIFAGGAEAAASLDAAAEMGLSAVAVLWHAPWIAASEAAESALAKAAAAHPHVMCLCLAVDASSDNKSFALEKVRLSPLEVVFRFGMASASLRLCVASTGRASARWHARAASGKCTQTSIPIPWAADALGTSYHACVAQAEFGAIV